jgi:hypothetical protein
MSYNDVSCNSTEVYPLEYVEGSRFQEVGMHFLGYIDA